MFRLCLAVPFLSLLLLTGCESKMEKMPDKELKRERSHCKQLKNPSPGKRMACENIYKEYDRRKKARRGG